MQTFVQKFFCQTFEHILISINNKLMKSVGSNGSQLLPFMMKVMLLVGLGE